MSGLSRRDWFGAVLLSPALLAMRQQNPPGPGPAVVRDSTPRAGAGQVGELFDPRVVGRARERTTGTDNDAAIQAIELKLRCTCGCTLDVFTCRTTDFTCTYSPEMHREVVALYSSGKTEPEIVAAFVAKYGEEVLMAPTPQGFNLAGYLVPGVLIVAVGALVAWIIRRRMIRRDAPRAAQPASPVAEASPEELERLERELEKIG